jgi:hypothetical protein
LSGTETRASGITAANLDRFSVSPNLAHGGARAVAGTNGYAILIFKRYSMPHMKVNDEWQGIHKMYVKISGDWRSVNAVYVKQHGVWNYLVQGSEITSSVLAPGLYYGAGGTRS